MTEPNQNKNKTNEQKREERRKWETKHVDNHNCIGLKLWQNTTQIPNHFCSPKWIHDRLWHYCLMSNLKKILYGETGIFKNNYLQRKIIWFFVEMAKDLCKNTVCVLNSFNVTIIKQFNIKTFYPPKGKKHRRQSCSDKTAHSSHGWVKNKRFVSMDSTNDSNSLELEVHKGTGVYISICLLGSVRQVIKIWLPRRL